MKKISWRFFIGLLIAGSGYLLLEVSAWHSFTAFLAVVAVLVVVFIGVFGMKFPEAKAAKPRKKGFVRSALDSTGGMMLFNGDEETRRMAKRFFK